MLDNDSLIMSSIKRAVDISLRFCFAGEVIMHGRRAVKWSSLRKDQRQEVIRVRMKVLQNTLLCAFDEEGIIKQQHFCAT